MIRMKMEGSVIEGGTIADEGTLIPMIDDIAEINLEDINHVLIIEKEATFRSIPIAFCREEKCLVVTGKGYPDVATREFLKALQDSIEILATNAKQRYVLPEFPAIDQRIPIFALVDNDPHGIEILLTYKTGSVAMEDQRRNLAVPAIKWLGVRQNDWTRRHDDVVIRSLLLSRMDRMKAYALLRRSFRAGEDIEEIRLEVSRILMHGRKAEIQVLDEEIDALLVFVRQSVAKERESFKETGMDSEEDFILED